MSGYYPDGCTQHTHDLAFGELGPSPAELAAEADSENDFDAEHPDAPEDDAPLPEDDERQETRFTLSEMARIVERDYISKRDAKTICRVFMSLERQVSKAKDERREADYAALCRLIGGLFYNALGPITAELGE